MSIEEFGNENKYKADKDLPHHLEHKPIYAIPYTQFDGMYANSTDCQYLSIGIAQWNNKHISIKTMRHTNDKWSRQSEELPLHRIIDSTILLSKVLFDSDNNIIELERKTFKNQDSAIRVKRENIDKTKIEALEYFLDENDILLKERLNSLYYILDKLKKESKF